MESLSSIQKFIISTLREDVEFNTLAKDGLGTDFSYFIDADAFDSIDSLPSITAFGIETTDAKGEDTSYVVQYNLSAEYNDKPVVENGISFYPTKGILENLAIKSIDLLIKEINTFGLNGECGKISITDKNLFLTDVGEAQDIQAIISMRLVEKKTM